ncbi:MAG: DUF3995 domain-containing protein [Myxococcota bacterium]
MAPVITAAGFSLLAVAHSVLGELGLIRPLFARDWELPIPRWASERILRFAWHLTSLAWLGLAAIALGASIWVVLAAVAAVSGLVIFFTLRGHLAWPLFFGTAAAAAAQSELLSPGLLLGVSISAAATLAVIGLIHLYWAARPHIDLSAAIPTEPGGGPVFQPPAWLTAGVGVALLSTATLFTLRALGIAMPGLDLLVIFATLVFGVRAVGDGRYVGFSKKQRDTRFGQLDDELYTPLSVSFAFGGLAALML